MMELYRIEVKDPKPKCFYLVVNRRHEVERWLKGHLLQEPEVELIAADHGPGSLVVDCRSGGGKPIPVRLVARVEARDDARIGRVKNSFRLRSVTGEHHHRQHPHNPDGSAGLAGTKTAEKLIGR
jgi:hypothetical protein